MPNPAASKAIVLDLLDHLYVYCGYGRRGDAHITIRQQGEVTLNFTEGDRRSNRLANLVFESNQFREVIDDCIFSGQKFPSAPVQVPQQRGFPVCPNARSYRV